MAIHMSIYSLNKLELPDESHHYHTRFNATKQSDASVVDRMAQKSASSLLSPSTTQCILHEHHGATVVPYYNSCTLSLDCFYIGTVGKTHFRAK